MSVSTECGDVRDCEEDNPPPSRPSPAEQEAKPSSVEGLSVQTVRQLASSSVDVGEERGNIMVVGTHQQQPQSQPRRHQAGLGKEKSCLLHTKSYLMNSLLHLQDRNKMLVQLSKQNNLDRQSRNIYHGKIYNYVLPPPRLVWTNKKQVMMMNSGQLVDIYYSAGCCWRSGGEGAGGQTRGGGGQGLVPRLPPRPLQADRGVQRGGSVHLLRCETESSRLLPASQEPDHQRPAQPRPPPAVRHGEGRPGPGLGHSLL